MDETIDQYLRRWESLRLDFKRLDLEDEHNLKEFKLFVL